MRNVTAFAVFFTALASSPAAAQLAPGAATQQASPAASTDTSGMRVVEVIVAGDPEELSNRRSEPLPPRFMERSERLTRITREGWIARGWSPASFDRMRQQNVHFCTQNADWAMRIASLVDRYKATVPRVADLAVKYDGMRRHIKRAATFSSVMNALSAGLSVFGGPVYAAVVIPNAIGNEGNRRASTRQQLLSNEAGRLSNELTGLHVEFNLLSLELYTGYLDMVVRGYCTDPAVVASYNNQPVATR